MTRSEIEKAVEPIIRECLRKFGDYSPAEISSEDFARTIAGDLRADVRRVSLLVSLTQSVTGGTLEGEGLELGCGYGYLLFPMAQFNPQVRWTAVEHPDRRYFDRPEFQQAMRDNRCRLVGCDFVHEPLPFPDRNFSVLTFSETLEHLPVERLNFVMDEIARVLRPAGLLIASSPNQASLENRIRLLKGRSILDLPDHVAVAKGTFGHIRLYTPDEIARLMSRLGFSTGRVVLESNNSVYRGASSKSLRRRLYRLYEMAEQRLDFLRRFGDTWYMVFRKGGAS
ncbi:MAG TPA: class I SAM-dependent methyltransferase [Candidatus Acidoferrum sp.]|nr:class I SAM-dependent methyltransferase [Candidatus Acidoferrum sp.]